MLTHRIILESDIFESYEYFRISKYYENQTAKRSGVPLINHINEGIKILNWISSSFDAKKAYCLHPLLQSDIALRSNYDGNFPEVDLRVLTLAMEYRNIANAYLSKRKIDDLYDIQLSPLKEVNDMLIADKIQNRKDFELYHINTHPKSKELNFYFKNWLARLGIKEETYQEYKQKLIELA